MVPRPGSFVAQIAPLERFAPAGRSSTRAASREAWWPARGHPPTSTTLPFEHSSHGLLSLEKLHRSFSPAFAVAQKSRPPYAWRPCPLERPASDAPCVFSGLTSELAHAEVLLAWPGTTPRPPNLPSHQPLVMISLRCAGQGENRTGWRSGDKSGGPTPYACNVR
jgi:hypothetical protein